MNKRIFGLICILIGLCLAVVSVLLFFNHETDDLQNQEQLSELVAEQYLISVSQQNNCGNGIVQDNNVIDSEFEYDDNEIYAHYSESRAKGYVDCVLEIPAIDLRQSIFTGTVDQLRHDLASWLAVTARADYILGDTQYCIYMHNPRDKSVKISHAQDNLHEGDYMVVTKDNTVYLYQVTGVFAEWRNKCSDIYVNSKNVSSDKLYIFTCGRKEWQGRNVVIEGTVYAVYTTSDWNNNKDQYVENYKKDIGMKNEDEQTVKNKEQLIMSVSQENDNIVIALRHPNYISFSDCSICVLNSDGYFAEGFDSPIEYIGDDIVLPKLPDGEYYIGLYENNTGYRDPIPYQIVVKTESRVLEFATMDEIVEEDQQSAAIMRVVAITMLVFAILFGVITIIKTKRREN